MKKKNYVEFGNVYVNKEFGRVTPITKAMYNDELIVVYSFINDGGTVSEPYAMAYAEFLQKFC